MALSSTLWIRLVAIVVAGLLLILLGAGLMRMLAAPGREEAARQSVRARADVLSAEAAERSATAATGAIARPWPAPG